jgi:hypothetical protein
MNKFRSFALAAAVAASGTVALGVAPAEASSSVTACFRWANNTAYASQPMELWRTDSRGNLISLVKSGRSAANGCGTFYGTPTNVYLRAVAQYNTPPVWGHYDHYQGFSPLIGNPGTAAANVSSAYVTYAWSI